MFGNLLGGLISPQQKEQAINDIIKGALEDNAEELGCKHNELFIMIKPKNDKFDFDLMLYSNKNGNPKPIRKIKLKELLE